MAHSLTNIKAVMVKITLMKPTVILLEMNMDRRRVGMEQSTCNIEGF
jgi:hypothetical protein